MSIDIEIKYFTNGKGMRFFTQRWIPSNPRALIFIVHGLGEHSGRYTHVINHFAREGYGVATYDMRGHGLSDGRRGDVERFEQWVGDLHTFVWDTCHRLPNRVPVVIIAHSMGALIALNYAILHPDALDAMILSSPLIGLNLELPKWKRWLFTKLAHIFPRIPVNNEINPDDLSRDRDEVRTYLADPLVTMQLTMRSAIELLNAVGLAMPLAFRVRHPILALHARGDRICSAEATQLFFNGINDTRKKLILYDGCFHEPLHDVVRDEALQQMSSWLKNTLTNLQSHAQTHRAAPAKTYREGGKP